MRNLSSFSGMAGFVLLATVITSHVCAEGVIPDTLTFCPALGNAELPAKNQLYVGYEDPEGLSCSAHIWVTQNVYDSCGGSIIYEAVLYIYDTGTPIQVIAPTSAVLDSNNGIELSFDTRNSSLSPAHPITIGGLRYRSLYCAGTLDGKNFHRLVWTVTNTCGQVTFYETMLEVIDCTPPRPVCVGLSSVVFPSSGQITIWAKDFESGASVDDCAEDTDLLYSFSGTVYEPSREYDCYSTLCEGPSIMVEIWVADGGQDLDCDGFVQPLGVEWSERGKDFCTAFLVFDDLPNNPCDCDHNHGPYRVTDSHGNGMSNVEVFFEHNGQIIQVFVTDEDGYYGHFINPLLNGYLYPVKDDDYRHGVSTLDLVKLQKHLLGFELLSSPYRFIAADINSSEHISALDLVDLRKVILGLTDGFLSNKSWRFVPKSFQFPDTLDPWPFLENAFYSPADTFDGNFIGIKIGDVNGTALLGSPLIEVRSPEAPLKLMIIDEAYATDSELEVPIYAGSSENILGFQFTMETGDLKLISVIPGVLDISEENVAVHANALTLSWAAVQPKVMLPDKPLFTLRFQSSASGITSERLSISSAITPAEAYRQSEEGSEPTIHQVVLQYLSHKPSDLFTIYPNPVKQDATLRCSIPDAGNIRVLLTDIMGRAEQVHHATVSQGHHVLPVRMDEVSPGVYICSLILNDMIIGQTRICVVQE